MKLRRPLLRSASPTRAPESSSPESTSGSRLLRPLLLNTSSTASSTPPSRLARPSDERLTVIDFDIETLAGGYGEPDWVTDIITAFAYKPVDGGDLVCETLPIAHLFDNDAKRAFLAPLLEVLRSASVLTGHNIRRFDLRVINTSAVRLELEPIRRTFTHDTMRINVQTKGLKKGQDNWSTRLKVMEKKAMNFEEWAVAYGESDHAMVRERVSSDVLSHIQIREKLLKRGLLPAPRLWR